ncbi:MAG: hypothetical protein FWD16_03985 [Clostridia bacterium]|nr:hypothetical protein [Clostridia bacterium]
MMNRCEAEIDKIRLKLYQETKALTKEERTRKSNELATRLALQYGFTVCSSSNADAVLGKPEYPLQPL